jgi:hypothetical protein
MNWPVIVLDGPALNQTLATIRFDQHGDKTHQEIFICSKWETGFAWAQEHGYSQALFVKSGTVFSDWIAFKELVNRYPHQGLIAHIIWPPGGTLALDEQCWFANINQFDIKDLLPGAVDHPVPIRSEQNLHDDYTPLWVKAGTAATKYTTTLFGQGLIAQQLSNNQPVVNWNNAARDLKSFMYNGQLDLTPFQEYKTIAENQLWLFNNEPMVVVKKSQLVSPGSGLSWMVNIVDPATTTIQIVDISSIQLKFCQELWNNWDGLDYGTFAWTFVSNNKLVHYELDNPQLTPLERLQLKGKTKFIEYVNRRFDQLVPDNFKSQWQLAKQTKQVDFCNANLIQWVLDNNIDKYDDIWCSNILNYKWTLLHTTVEQYTLFQSKIK